MDQRLLVVAVVSVAVALALRASAQPVEAPGSSVALEDEEGEPLEVAGEAALELAGEAAEHAAGRVAGAADDVPVLIPGAAGAVDDTLHVAAPLGDDALKGAAHGATGLADDVAKGGAHHADDVFKILRKAVKPLLGAAIGGTLVARWMQRRRQKKLQRD